MRLALALFLLSTALVGCIPDRRPPRLRDPAFSSERPEQFRGDGFDRDAVRTLRAQGAKFGPHPFEASADLAVAREALRVYPPRYVQAPNVVVRDAVTMALRRRPRAGYVALTELMRSPIEDVRAGAVTRLGELDARSGLRTAGSSVEPPARGPQRQAAVARAAELLTRDPSASVREAAAFTFVHELGSQEVPTAEELLDALARETSKQTIALQLELLSSRDATAAQRLAAVNQYAPDFMSAWRAVSGVLVKENKAAVEAAYRGGSEFLRQALLREMDNLEGSQPWIEGLILLGLDETEPGFVEHAAHATRLVEPLSPRLLARLRELAPRSPWAAYAVRAHESREASSSR
ncbi:MAG: hypothetical protein QNJ98_20140 [Planctomycetota bacterium]|nr:hypothetical protein [Planctomycetota bacterium]